MISRLNRFTSGKPKNVQKKKKGSLTYNLGKREFKGKEFVEMVLKDCKNKPLELKKLEAEDCSGIKSIQGIEIFKNLSYLDLDGNQITSIVGIEKLVNLTLLSLGNNQITSIVGIEKLINLTELVLSNNQITSIVGIEKLINLTVLGLINNQITSIVGIEKLINLTQLGLYSNQITSIVGIEKLINLTVLGLENNQITSIVGIEKLINLTQLGLSNNQITSIVGIEKLINLTQLGLRNNQITSIVGIEKLINLTQLGLKNNQITSIVGIEKLINLTTLGLENNQITSIVGIEKLINLTMLDLNNNQITSIVGIEKLINLTMLGLRNNQITSIVGIEKLINLTWLGLSNNQITSIVGIEKLKLLKWLGIEKLKISFCSKNIDVYSTLKLRKVTLLLEKEPTKKDELLKKDINGFTNQINQLKTELKELNERNKQVEKLSKNRITELQNQVKRLKRKNKSLKKKIAPKVVQIPRDEISYIRKKKKKIKLGSGSGGKVYKCEWNRRGKKVICAIKEYKLDVNYDLIKESILKEVGIAQLVKHPLVIKVFGCVQLKPKKIGVLMEYVDGGDLHEIIKTSILQKKKISNVEKWCLIRKIIESVQFLHLKRVGHGDIKPDNFLLSNDRKTLKICDFGLSKVKESSTIAPKSKSKNEKQEKIVEGTLRYIAPEVHSKGNVGFTFSSDIFSLGMTIYHIITGKRPFFEYKRENNAARKIEEGNLPKFIEEIPLEFKTLFQMCVDKDPSKRLTAKQLLGYMESTQIDFIRKNSVVVEKRELKNPTLLNLEYFFKKSTVLTSSEEECSQCFNDKCLTYFNPKCKDWLCENCVIQSLEKKRINDSKRNKIEIECSKNGCRSILSLEWLIGTKNNKVIEKVKEIEKVFFFVPCEYCSTMNDKRLINKKNQFSVCSGCKKNLCVLCNYEFLSKRNKCSFDGCIKSNYDYEVVQKSRMFEFVDIFSDKNPKESLGKIPHCRMCPVKSCKQINWRKEDGDCKHVKCSLCSTHFCFLCLSIGKNPRKKDGLMKCQWPKSCGNNNAYGYCNLAGPQMPEDNENVISKEEESDSKEENDEDDEEETESDGEERGEEDSDESDYESD